MNPRHAARRLAARHLARRPARLPAGFAPTVSFSFDDFPASAVRHAAPLLEAAGHRATWYASAGLLGTDTETGRIATAADVAALARAGHEIGNHGHGHRPADALRPAEHRRDAEVNRTAIAAIAGTAPASFSYPLGSVTCAAKRNAMAVATSARGIEPGIARGTLDRARLPANALYSAQRPMRGIAALLEEVARGGGWAILYTHDVADEPSPWGCTPADFAQAIAIADRLRLRVATVGDVAAGLA